MHSLNLLLSQYLLLGMLGPHQRWLVLLDRVVQLLVAKIHHPIGAQIMWCVHRLLLQVVLGTKHLTARHYWQLVVLDLASHHLPSDAWRNY
jgi:hypothetical protein